MNRINFNQIIIGDINKMFTEEQIQTMKKIAAKERLYITARYANNKDILLHQRAKEISCDVATRKNKKLSQRHNGEKERKTI